MLKSKFYLSLKIIQHLAKSENRVTMFALADGVDVSYAYTEKLLSVLRRGGLIRGFKGPKGGYELVDDALTDLRLIDLGKIVCPDDVNADDALIGRVLDGMVAEVIGISE